MDLGKLEVSFKYHNGRDWTKFKQNLQGETLDELIYAFQCFLMACGFSQELVKEVTSSSYIEGDIDGYNRSVLPRSNPEQPE
jgi:hypothetical protein